MQPESSDRRHRRRSMCLASRHSAHHSKYPEVCAEGSTPQAAATRLANSVTTLVSAPSDWRRQSVQQAIADVRAFAERDRS